MKKITILLALALLGIAQLHANRAKPGIVSLTLADGTTVSASLQGDENFHYYALADGTPLTRNAEGKYELTTVAQLQAKSQQAKARLATRATGIGNSFAYFPHMGSPKALVILVQFQDVKFKSSDPVATFNHYLNDDLGTAAPSQDASVYSPYEPHNNYGSVKEYFKECSQGKFTPQFDVVGPVTVSQKSAYYGKDEDDDNNDTNFPQMISEACALVADKVDFSKYDSDGDNIVDLVYIIYAGYSQSISGNSDDYLWPKCGMYSFTKYDTSGKELSPKQYLIYNDTQIFRYGINNELNGGPTDVTKDGKYPIAGIGTFCHEFSHAMGLPDLYDTNYKNADNQSPELWDVMDLGGYTRNGYCPTPYTPWERMMMGWVTPTTLDGEQAQQVTLEPYDEASKAYKIDADVTDDNFHINEAYGQSTVSATTKAKLMARAKGEYLLLQNIRNTGWYKYMPGKGMLVWRIDYADKSKVEFIDYPNNDIGMPRVMVVPADGLVINQSNCGTNGKYTSREYAISCKNDPFPAYGIGKDSTDVNSLTEVNFNWSTMTTRPIYNIAQDATSGIVSFDFLKDFGTTGIAHTEADESITDRQDNRPVEYFDLEGRKVAAPQKGHLYITNRGKKIVF